MTYIKHVVNEPYDEQINSTTTAVESTLSPDVFLSLKTLSLSREEAERAMLITKSKGVCGNAAIIHGTRISVANIVEFHDLLGWDIQKIIEEYPHLTEEHIEAALEYYKNHGVEIDNILKEEKEVDGR